MKFQVIRNSTAIGEYDEILFLIAVEKGEVLPTDLFCTEGMKECIPVWKFLIRHNAKEFHRSARHARRRLFFKGIGGWLNNNSKSLILGIAIIIAAVIYAASNRYYYVHEATRVDRVFDRWTGDSEKAF